MFYHLLFWLRQMKRYSLKLLTFHFGVFPVIPTDPCGLEEYRTYQDRFASMWDNVNPLLWHLGVPTMYVPSLDEAADLANQNTCATNQQLSDFLKKQRPGYLELQPLPDLVELISYEPLGGEKPYV